MRESQLYIQFIRKNSLFLILPVILSLLVCIYLYASVATYSRVAQTFKLTYDLQNIDSVLALTDQAVTELRAQKFAEVFPEASVNIYKSSPFNISIEATSLQRETSYALLLKEIEFLRQNFNVEQLTSPEISIIEPNLFKYLMSGLIVGGLIGLIASLTREYLRNY